MNNIQNPDVNIIAETNKQKPLSLQVQCPFELKWSLLEYKRPYRNQIFYKVKVSNLISTEHTCMMSHMSYRTAFKSFKGLQKLDLSTVNTAVEVLKSNPSLSTRVLRPLLKHALPASTHISGQHVDNFRRRVALYHLKNKDTPMVTTEEGRSLTKEGNLDMSEYIGMNDPIVQSNLDDMYAKVMELDSNTWSAI